MKDLILSLVALWGAIFAKAVVDRQHIPLKEKMLYLSFDRQVSVLAISEICNKQLQNILLS